jgi:hypothetical protein
MNEDTINQLNSKLEELDSRRAEILFELCNNDKLWIPEIIMGLVSEARSITKLIRMIKG